MRLSEPVRMESPLCRCYRRTAAVHAALCSSPRLQSQRLPSTDAHKRPMRQTGASIEARRRAGAGRPSGAAHPAGGDVRGVCPILVLVKCLQKEHLA